MASRNFTETFNTLHNMPVLLDCNFVVDSTNGNGLGLRSLKGPGIANVFMHTSATPGSSNGILNPNPAAGTIVVQLKDKYNRSYSGGNAQVSPVSGRALLVASAGLTLGVAYIIVSLGTTTAAAFHALGVSAGITPAVGVAFIATATSAVGTGAVEITAALGSNIATIETVGDPNLSINPDPALMQGFGAQFILQCRDHTGAIAAPANGAVISLQFLLSNSVNQTQGE